MRLKAVPAAARRAKRVIDSTSPSPPEPDAEGEDELELDNDDGIAAPEEPSESEEDRRAYARSGVSSVVASEEMELDPAPASALRIRLKVNNEGGRRPSRAAAQKSGRRTKRVAMEAAIGSGEEAALYDYDEPDPEDELPAVTDAADLDLNPDPDVLSHAGSSRRSGSPSKLTARQRAKGNKDLQETLIALPNEGQGKKLILTEAERLQRREEMARRRKRQSEQRLQDEQDQTINRLLRAQTGRSRSKLDGPTLASVPAATTESHPRVVSPTRRPVATGTGMIRWVSSIRGEGVSLRVGVPLGKEGWLDLGGQARVEERQRRDVSGVCAVEGCAERRKYRSMRQFEVGGCCLQHLKAVEAGLAG